MKTTLDRIAEVWGPRTPYAKGEDWPIRVDSYLEDGLSPEQVDRWVQSAAILHSNGDGLDIAVKGGRIVGVRGRAVDRVNRGRVDPKDLFGWQANSSPDRLHKPLLRRSGKLREASWDEAMGAIVKRSKSLLAEKGPLAFGFYTSGQLFLEEYYTLAVLGKAGIGTPHMDGNTRLCTATSAAALKASFGTDGQPGSYTDIDHTDCLALFGHNVAETQTVLWMRMLDRLDGKNPPKLVVVDPRPTVPARRADVHLAPVLGTNLALMNGLLREVIVNNWIDADYIARSTVMFEKLKKTVLDYPAEKVAEICAIRASDLKEAARILGTTPTLFSTVLQGFYQSMSATASSIQVNNLHLIRGMIGRPGCGLCQMNGQPTAQNTRETGADGDLPGFRNWDNTEHIAELARIWNVDFLKIPHWAAPTHAMQIFRFAEQGSIQLLWISATNPAVSLPELERIRKILSKDQLFVIVQDAFMTETTQFADVVLPAAIWGEKTGTFTNADRTVHLSEKAVTPPGEAKSDLDIFLDYARRMDFRDKDGNPLIKWDDAEGAFEAWKACSQGRPCDYTGMSYEKLRGGSGIQWPCNEQAPNGTERLYTAGRFNTDADYCETYGHDLPTGGENPAEEYKAKNPAGRAILHAAHYLPPHEQPSDDYPFWISTGRTVYHFHTRTKTARAPQLQNAAPDVWVEISPVDAEKLGIQEGDWVRVESPRSHVDGQARICGIRQGVVFIPFHYGYFDEPEGKGPNGRQRAANELTLTEWDPVSKQPYYKFAAGRVKTLRKSDGEPAPAPTNTASAPVKTK